MALLTEARHKELMEKPLDQITPEEIIELNSIQDSGPTGYVQIGNALRAIQFARTENLPREEKILKRKYPTL